MPCHAMPCRAMPCHAMPCRAMPCRAVPYRAVLCCVVLCCAMLCYAMPCSALLCSAMPCMSCHMPDSETEPGKIVSQTGPLCTKGMLLPKLFSLWNRTTPLLLKVCNFLRSLCICSCSYCNGSVSSTPPFITGLG